MWKYNNTNELYHHGVLGMKWGVRRYQNKDGSLTSAGRKRYDVDIGKAKQNYKEAKVNQRKASRNFKRKSMFVDNQQAASELKRANNRKEISKIKLDIEKNEISDELK